MYDNKGGNINMYIYMNIHYNINTNKMLKIASQQKLYICHFQYLKSLKQAANHLEYFSNNALIVGFAVAKLVQSSSALAVFAAAASA